MGVSRSKVIVSKNNDKTAYGAVRSIQYVSTVLDKDTTSDSLAPGVAFTDYTKVVVIPVAAVIVTGGSGGQFANVRWQVLGNTNITVFHTAPGGSAGTSGVAAAYAVEFY